MKKTIETKDNVNNKHTTAKFEISEESRQAFIRAMKIGYYKAFHKQGLLTLEQLEKLIDMNTVKTVKAVNDDNAANDNNNPAA